MNNDFYNIAAMTKEFKTREVDLLSDVKEKDFALSRLWELRLQLAIAQQLAVISGRLGEIVEKAKQ